MATVPATRMNSGVKDPRRALGCRHGMNNASLSIFPQKPSLSLYKNLRMTAPNSPTPPKDHLHKTTFRRTQAAPLMEETPLHQVRWMARLHGGLTNRRTTGSCCSQCKLPLWLQLRKIESFENSLTILEAQGLRKEKDWVTGESLHRSGKWIAGSCLAVASLLLNSRRFSLKDCFWSDSRTSINKISLTSRSSLQRHRWRNREGGSKRTV